MRPFLLIICSLLACCLCGNETCEPPITLNIPAPTPVHAFLSQTVDMTVAFNAPIPFSGPSLLNGGMLSSGGRLTVPSAGNYLAIISLVPAEDPSNFGLAVNGSGVLGGVMDDSLATGVTPGIPYAIALIVSLNSGDIVDVRNLSIDLASKTLAATNSSAGASSRANLTLIKLSTP